MSTTANVNATATWAIQLNSGLRVTLPADLDNPVTLTLLEYETWPEPEYGFWCQLAQPGLRLLDTDTGYGIYALSLAQALHGQGRVLALNPDPLFARSVADNGLQAVIHTEAETQVHSDHHQPATSFDLIRLGASTPLDPRWLHQADPLFLLPSDSPALAELQAAGLGLYRLIPALNALVAQQDVPDANTNIDGVTEHNSQSALEKLALFFACNATRADWLIEQGRLIRSA